MIAASTMRGLEGEAGGDVVRSACRGDQSPLGSAATTDTQLVDRWLTEGPIEIVACPAPTHPRGDDLVEYDTDARVAVSSGSGQAELDFEPVSIGQLPGAVYTPGEDDGADDRIELTIPAGATTTDTDASSPW